MSRQTTPKGSPLKHKGMKTSLITNEQHLYPQPPGNIYSKTNRIFVETVKNQPNVMPYIDSQYTSPPPIINETYSEYVPVFQRHNNFIRDPRQPGAIQNVIRISPIQGSRIVNNLSKSKLNHIDQNRFQGSGSTFVPPPPESFLINNTRVPEHRSPTMGSPVITVTSPPAPVNCFQSVKKTYVPHHIINEIPVYNNNRQVYAESGEEDSNGEGNQVLMRCYQKLYEKYESQKQQNEVIRQNLADAMKQISILRSQLQAPQTKIREKVGPPQQSKVVDRQRLQDLLSQKWSKMVDEVVERSKQSCINQVDKMVETNKETLRIPWQIIERQFSKGGSFA